MMKLILDYLISFFLLLIFFIPTIIIFIALYFSKEKKILHWSRRIGKNNEIFLMPKFVTMTLDSPDLATHLFDNSNKYITPLGAFLRKTSLDELPQIYSVLKRDMSIVGPRPALHNQEDLMDLRTKQQIHILLPGITGWAQINGRDNISINEKVKLDLYYKMNLSLFLDLKIIFLTIFSIINKKNIKH